MVLESANDEAILGYAGLGQTAGGTQPAEWMSAVLRGRPGSIETRLQVLVGAMQAQLPRHMLGLPGHNILIPALIANRPVFWSIDLTRDDTQPSGWATRWTRPTVGNTDRAPRFAVGGSGSAYIVRNRHLLQNLLRVLRAFDRGLVTKEIVADQFAALNDEVHRGMGNTTVGPRSLVVWRHRRNGVHAGVGGGHYFYTGVRRDRDFPAIPSIVTGIDMAAFANELMPGMAKQLTALMEGKPDPGVDLGNAIEVLRRGPDEKLR